jgi:hypothetical protein
MRLLRKVDLFVRVSNVFDRDYENFGLIGEDPDEVISTLDNDSPIFLGSGAPRAVWAGAKILHSSIRLVVYSHPPREFSNGYSGRYFFHRSVDY